MASEGDGDVQGRDRQFGVVHVAANSFAPSCSQFDVQACKSTPLQGSDHCREAVHRGPYGGS